jgi:hypothetical protein
LPERELLARFKDVRWVKFDIEGGKLPLKPLLERLRIVRLFQTEKSEGNGPEKLLD